MRISFKTILKNIHPPGTTRGFLAASLSTSHPDYFYTWTRDAALVVRVLCDLPETEDNLLKDYVEFQADTQNIPTVCQCLGEPKFNPDGSAFSGPWGRPQNDGPAERAITFMKIINRFKGKHDDFIRKTIMTALEKDLDYIVRVWEEPCFDLWEEVNGIHFYTLMVMRRALMDGYHFFNNKNYQSTANDIQKRLETFWSPEENYIRVTQDEQSGVNKTSGLDVSVLLAASTFSSISEGFFTPASDKILATAAAIESAFLKVYSINKDLKTDLGTAIGRYPEDVYDGYEKSEGNPWFLATAAYAELYYLAIEEWKQKGIEINKVNKPFFERIAPFDYGTYAPNSDQWQQIISKVSTEADKFLATVQFHQQANGSMSEQFNRNTGRMQGARDLTWSHAAFISAVKAKEGLPITPVITST
ncbi:hypothetical protein G6F46_001512 [Rhizopus delemar]|uniref:glucan 1,4-alpha-glucosidase n=2 Tax=Rhizopus TaxID=4842 RepID=A0A9P7CUG4_9FUNG|nr:hypothetical protein G6F55_000786 [Rhizopus delemar]KAG1551798.1 hypothetical protein G6F51_001628 [Rhizopus arrhizus]KAG1525188.1 hypothetical protein G6F52_003550 [Rhizopus delemar]KAG1561384.1 hypothetical protein G6F49_001846 [Rhizopus delemar]KAG1575220.1 hypothetical protein G6F50_001269 [Rhizopus delemar]